MPSGERSAKGKTAGKTARTWLVRGRVQGVGYRYFAQRAAADLGLTGHVRNLDDGRVEVYAVGQPAQLDELAGLLHRGPRWSEVTGVDEMDAPVRQGSEFRIE
jgi:acylphosphatase